ncbi:MAG TPA: ABC transporter substrate-binding protein, partial [Pseudobdellovibrionaceae bacterium]|nr:ABC transporter substrate-binding protein [Pseudobdellovibrionaceae bacterium]
ELNWSTYANANIDAGMKSPYLKIHVQTELPRMLVFVGMNFENEILKSKNVRRAMALLMDRKSFNEKYFFNLYDLAVGPFMRTSPYFVPDLKPTPFDPSAARLLLQGDLWERNPQTGILEKTINGKKVPLELKLAFGNKFYAPLWDQYQQELRQVGIKLNIEKIDSPRLWELLTERKVTENKIDMWAMAWSETTLEGDPIQVWHSDSARKGGVNFGHYKNELVDQLIDKARREPNSKKRIELFKKASTLIAEDQPYVFMYNNKYVFYAHSKRIRKPQNSFRYGIGTETWWSSDIQNTKASK